MPELRLDEKSIFNVAREIGSAEARVQYLRQVCGEDPTTEDRIKQLLHNFEKRPNFLELPVAEIELRGDHSTGVAAIGSRIGHYTLREQIGEGGMGVVYVAEQTEPVRRKVALKIIKSGIATKDALSRFEAERQTLAMMDHPNIARIFDGGETETGQPYFVMELVQGEPLTDYCDQRQLANRDRLRLFQQVCRAVQHAHQKGVVHRDIKPSNVLVAHIDDTATPKVIDFGVAKAVNENLTERTVYTRFAQLIGTPLYMSPEQVEMGVTDVDTRSDVYSLGVLLYELLTGTLPFDGDALSKVSFDEMRRIIREEEPLHPSRKVQTLRGDVASTVSSRRRSDRRCLKDSLTTELDWIVMKALEKDRNRRYESASALADDIERYLSDEPIQARPASTLYRMGKFTRRHRTLVVSAAAVLAALCIGLVLATVGYMTAERRLIEITRERENSQLLSELLKDMYPTPWGVTTQGRKQTVYDSIEQLSTSLGDRLRNRPSVEIEVRKTFGSFYGSVNELEKARNHLNVALDLALRKYGPTHEIVGEIYADLAGLVGWYGEGPLDAETILSQAENAISIYESLGRDAPVQAWFAKHFCLSQWPERKAEAEAACRQYVRLARKTHSSEPVIPLWDLGVLLMDQGRFDEAQIEFENALRVCRAEDFPPAIMGTVLSGLGKNYRRQKNITAAKDAFLEAWNLYMTNNLQDEPRGHLIGLELAEVYFASGDIDQAFEQVETIEGLAKRLERFELLAECLFLKGWFHYKLENYGEAELLFREAMQVARDHVGEDHPRYGWPAAYLAFILESKQRSLEAEPIYRRMRTQTKQRFIDKPIVYWIGDWAYVRATLGTCGSDEDQLRDAARVANHGLDFINAWPWPWLESAFQLELAKIHQRRGNEEAAIRSFRRGLDKATEPLATYVAMRSDLPTTREELEIALANLLVDSAPDGREQARRVFEEGVVIREHGLGIDHIQTALAQLRLGEFLVAYAGENERRRAGELIRDAYRKLDTHSSTAVTAICRRAALQLADLYDALGQPDEAANWRTKLDQLDRSPESVPPEEMDPGDLQRRSADPKPPESMGQIWPNDTHTVS